MSWSFLLNPSFSSFNSRAASSLINAIRLSMIALSAANRFAAYSFRLSAAAFAAAAPAAASALASVMANTWRFTLSLPMIARSSAICFLKSFNFAASAALPRALSALYAVNAELYLSLANKLLDMDA